MRLMLVSRFSIFDSPPLHQRLASKWAPCEHSCPPLAPNCSTSAPGRPVRRPQRVSADPERNGENSLPVYKTRTRCGKPERGGSGGVVDLTITPRDSTHEYVSAHVQNTHAMWKSGVWESGGTLMTTPRRSTTRKVSPMQKMHTMWKPRGWGSRGGGGGGGGTLTIITLYIV